MSDKAQLTRSALVARSFDQPYKTYAIGAGEGQGEYGCFAQQARHSQGSAIAAFATDGRAF
jgi:hypothetical protein